MSINYINQIIYFLLLCFKVNLQLEKQFENMWKLNTLHLPFPRTQQNRSQLYLCKSNGAISIACVKASLRT